MAPCPPGSQVCGGAAGGTAGRGSGRESAGFAAVFPPAGRSCRRCALSAFLRLRRRTWKPPTRRPAFRALDPGVGWAPPIRCSVLSQPANQMHLSGITWPIRCDCPDLFLANLTHRPGTSQPIRRICPELVGQSECPDLGRPLGSWGVGPPDLLRPRPRGGPPASDHAACKPVLLQFISILLVRVRIRFPLARN